MSTICRQPLPACANALRGKCTRKRCQVDLRTFAAPASIGEQWTYDVASNQFIEGGAGGVSELIVRNGGFVKADSILIGGSGTLKGNGGTIQGTLTNHGIVAPGQSPGTLDAQGDFARAADGTLIIESGGTTPGSEYDVLDVSGKLTLGGTLEIVLLNGFLPGSTDTFDFRRFGSLEGAFDHFIVPTSGNGETLHLVFGNNGISAVTAPVPIPMALWLFGPAIGALGLARRRA